MGHMYVFRDKSANGVFIEDVNGMLWKTDDWDGSVKPNAIAVIADESKFRIALNEPSSRMAISCNSDPLEDYMTEIIVRTAARADYNGACNTAKILRMRSSIGYAAGYCNAFTFPDGKTKGFLPSLGQLYLAYQNKDAVDAALNKCGGTAMTSSYYWSSSFWGIYGGGRRCWELFWGDGTIGYDRLDYGTYVRPFANF